MKRNKKLLAVIISAVCAVCICVGGFLGYRAYTDNTLENIQAKALAELDAAKGDYEENSIVLSNTTEAKAKELAELFGAELRITENGEYAALTLPDDVTIRDIYQNDDYRQYIEDMSADYHVSIADGRKGHHDGRHHRHPKRPNKKFTDKDYDLQTEYDYVNVESAWDKATGKNITVAVLDTGIDTDHPEFSGRISEYSYNASEDKIVKDCLTEDGSYDWSVIEDEQGHGTTVAGVISASMNSGSVVGVAPNVNLIVIKAECNEDGEYRRTSDLVFGIYYAIERGANVLNMSFGDDEASLENEFAEALSLAYDSDMVCVASAGNNESSSPFYPAASENVIGVGALESNSWDLANYSNYGENTDITAPGTVYTTVMGGGYGLASGTSYSAPMVTGAVALAMQADKYMTVDEVAELLYASAYDLGDLGPDNYFGYGLVDISALVTEDRVTVTFDMLTDELENTEQTVISGHTIMDISEPERLYAVFDGWYYDDTFTQEYVYYEDAVEDDITLYAKWVNEDDGVPFTYVTLDDGTVEIRSYTGRRRYITVPEIIDGKTVSSIGDDAFSGESELRQITLPDTVTTIGERAFQGCSSLVAIDIPKQVKTLENAAFDSCSRLEKVNFASGAKIENIMGNVFRFCSRLEYIAIPKTVDIIEGTAFFGTVSLKEINVELGNPSFVSKDGVLFTKSMRTLVAFPASHGTSYDIPDITNTIGSCAFAYCRFTTVDLEGITSIGKYAFANSTLCYIGIPDSVTEMGEFAFAASKVRSVALGDGLTKIAENAFRECLYLVSVTIGENILTVEDYAFYKNTSLVKLNFSDNANIVSIGQNAFYQNARLQRVDFPASLIEIGANAFEECLRLSEITFEDGSHLKKIGDDAFCKTLKLASAELPDGLEVIGENAFTRAAISQVTVPASVTELGTGAFAGCEKLTSIEVADGNKKYHDIDGVVFDLDNTSVYAYPSGNARTAYDLPDTVTVIEPYAFSIANNLKSVTLHEGLEEIGQSAFYLSAAMTKLDVPDSVVQIGRYAFNQSGITQINFNDTSTLPRISYAAFAYSSISSIRIPASVSTVSQGAFYGCKNLTSVTFASGSKLDNIPAYMFDGCDNLTNLVFEENSSLRAVQAHGLEGMTKLTAIDFSNTKLEEIDNFSFRFCESLTSLTLPEGTLNIGRYAFYGCKSLAELSVPSTVEHIGPFAFLGTDNARVLFASESLPLYIDENWDYGISGYYLGVKSVHTSGDFEYAVTTADNIAILDYTGTATALDLNTLDLGGDITVIGGGAFEGGTVESITLPDTLTTIQATAFAYSPLKKIDIPASVTFIGKFAFAEAPVSEVIIPDASKLRTIEQYAFTKTDKLESIVLPASLEIMGSGVFCESSLSSVTFADGIKLEEIPQKAFAETGLTSVVIPDSVTLVNHNAFNNVQTLDSVTIGGGKDLRLMSNAFYHTGLDSLHIPANVSYIGEYCFVAVSDLTEFTVDEDNPNYAAIDGLLTTKTGRKLIAVPAGRTGTLEVPTEVEEIGFGAFEESKLSAVTFDKDANILSLGYRAFFKANNITSINIPASVVSVDYYAFAYCENLGSVTFAEGNQLKGIYEGAFCGAASLRDITVPDTVVEISDFAFYGCESLKQLPLTQTTGVMGIYDYAFAYSGVSGDVTLPDTLIDIGQYAFLSTDITSATVPDTNKKYLFIEKGAFEECNALTEMTLPFIGMEYEGANGFLGYIFGAGSYEAGPTFVPESLKTVTITEGISYVDTGAFYNLEHLENINVPASVTTLHSYAFLYTNAYYELKNEISLVKTASVQQISTHDAYFGYGMGGEVTLKNAPATSSNLFSGCKNLKGAVIPDGVVKTYRMFRGCSSLEWVSLPDSITTLNDAFYNCIKLKSVKLPASLTSLSNTFFNCESLEKVTLNDGLLTISDFYYCTSLKEIYIPASVTSISAFQGCSSLEKIVVDENNANYCSVDGILYDKNVTKMVRVPGGYDAVEHLVLPETIAELADQAFMGTNIRNITIPGNIQTIPQYCFANCTELESVTLEDGVLTVGWRSFDNCTKLKCLDMGNTVTTIREYAFTNTVIESLVVPASVTDVDLRAFENCSELKTIEVHGPTLIPNQMFVNCEKLKSVIIGDEITGISHNAFCDITSIEEITVGSSLEAPGSYSQSFESCTVLHTIYNNSDLTIIPGASGNYGLGKNAKVVYDKDGNATYATGVETFETVETEDGFRFTNENGNYTLVEYTGDKTTVTLPDNINGNAYSISGLIGIENVIIPEGFTEISDNAFKGNKNLKSVQLPKTLERIGRHAFYECVSLKEIVIPDAVTVIGDYAFDTCEKLEKIELNYGLEKLGQCVFGDCESLKEVIIPETVKDIGSHLFISSGIEKVVFPKNVDSFDGDTMFWCCYSAKTIVLPENITEISYHMFYGCSIQSLTIPDTVKKIGGGAFESSRIRNLIVPDSVTTVQSSAFKSGSLETIHIGAGVTSLPQDVFTSCPKLRSVTVSEDNQYYYSENGILYDKDVTRLIYAPKTIKGELVIPDTVTVIDSLQGCAEITSIDFPDNITKIGKLSECTGIEKLVIPSTVTEVGSLANCTALKEIVIPEGVTKLGSFEGCSSLESVTLPDSVVTCGSFKDCTSLVSADFGDGIDSSPDFHYCSSLENVSLGNSKYLGSFYYCKKLKNITIPDGVTSIGRNAFFGCSALESIDIPDSVTSIGWHSFSQATSLKHVKMSKNVVSMDMYAFSGCPLEELTLPETLVSIKYDAISDANFKTLHIPASVTTLDSGFIQDCESLESITVDEDNPNYTAVNGILYNKDVTEIVYVPNGIKGDVVIPDTVTEIPASAFAYRRNLGKVTLGSAITRIEKQAFYYSNINELVIKNAEVIGNQAFYGCDKLEYVVNETELEFTIGAEDYGYIAYYADKLVQDDITTYIDGVTNLIFHQTDDGFRFMEKDGAYTLVAYEGTGNTVTLPLTFKDSTYTIYKVTGIANLVIPEGFTKIDEKAFYQNKSLKTVSFPSTLTEIGREAFYMCTLLEDVHFPDSLTTIGISAFAQCRLLSEIRIPDSVETIDTFAFASCGYTKDHTDVYLGRGITKLGVSPFPESSSSETWYHYKDFEMIFDIRPDFGENSYIYLNGERLTTITIPENITELPDYAFSGYDNLEGVILHDNITSIGVYAFYRCEKLKTIDIPDSVTYIGDSAFYYSGVESITIPESVTVLNKYLFNGSNLKELNLHDGITYIGKETIHSAYYSTPLYDDPDNWTNGALVIDGYLFNVAEDTKYIDIPEGGFKCIAADAYTDAYSLKNAEYYQEDYIGIRLDSLGATNVETLYVTDFKNAVYFNQDYNKNVKNFVITDDVDATDLRYCDKFFTYYNVTGVTIYVEGDRDDLRWDDNFPGWHNGNKVVYGDNWSWTRFYDTEGALIYCEPRLNSAVIRLPAQAMPDSDHYTYEVIGWDIDGDGEADNIPATAVVDIDGYPVTEAVAKVYTVTFADADGTVYSQKKFSYGDIITLPDAPEKTGYSFDSWDGYSNGMTASADITLTALWTHDGDGHVYGDTVTVKPTCTEQGYDRRTCTVCGEHDDTNFVDALGHDEAVSTVEPTCTEGGYDKHYCSRCEKTWADKLTAASGHSYGEWITDIAPECEATGTQHRVCTVCGDTENGIANATGHDYTEEVLTKATCKNSGNSRFICSDCGDVTYETTSKTSHSYKKRQVSKWFIDMLTNADDDIIYSTDENGGYYYACTDCGKILTTLAYGEGIVIQDGCQHSSKESVVINTLTCESDGIDGEKCTACGDVVTVRAYAFAGGHSIQKVERKAADVGVDGHEEYYVCVNCGECYYDAQGTNVIADIDEWKAGEGNIAAVIAPTVEFTEENITALDFKENKVNKVYWGYIGTENTEYTTFGSFKAQCGDTLVATFGPKNGKTFNVLTAGYYRFVVNYTDVYGTLRDEVCTVYVEKDAVIVPEIALNDSGDVATLTHNFSTPRRVYWGYIGKEKTEYKWFSDFKAECGLTYAADYKPEDGEQYILSEAGYYRFVISYYDINGDIKETEYTVEVSEDTKIKVPVIKMAENGQGATLSVGEYGIKKVYYGYVGTEYNIYVWFNQYKNLCGSTFTSDFAPVDGENYVLEKAGYYQFVAVYEDGDGVSHDLVYTVKIENGIELITFDAESNNAVLDYSGLKPRKLYWGYIGEENTEYTSFSEFKKTAAHTFANDFKPENGEKYTLSKPGYYRFVVNYIAANGKERDLIYTVEMSRDTELVVPVIEMDGDNTARLTLNGSDTAKLYYGYIGEEYIPYVWYAQFKNKAASTFTSDFGPEDGESYILENAGYYQFVVVHTDKEGATRELVYTVKVEKDIELITLSEDGDSAVLDYSGLKPRKVYWGFIGEENTEYTSFSEFKTQCGDTFVSDFGPKDGKEYALSQSGYYRFVVNYIAANGKERNLIYTVKID